MIEQPPIQPTPVGALRFNTDSAKLEYFNGNEYVNITTDSPEQNTGGALGVYMGGSPGIDTIDEVQISTTGDAVDFGNLTVARNDNGDGGMASRTRGFFARGASPITGRIEFITFSTTGNATDFGDLTQARQDIAGGISDAHGGLAQ